MGRNAGGRAVASGLTPAPRGHHDDGNQGRLRYKPAEVWSRVSPDVFQGSCHGGILYDRRNDTSHRNPFPRATSPGGGYNTPQYLGLHIATPQCWEVRDPVAGWKVMVWTPKLQDERSLFGSSESCPARWCFRWQPSRRCPCPASRRLPRYLWRNWRHRWANGPESTSQPLSPLANVSPSAPASLSIEWRGVYSVKRPPIGLVCFAPIRHSM